MYRLCVSKSFAAAHQLRGYGGECEALHGHNWRVQLYVTASKVNEIGLVIDFKELKESLQKIFQILDHSNLNELPPFMKENPSSENIAYYIFKGIDAQLQGKDVIVEKIRVWESENSYAEYFAE